MGLPGADILFDRSRGLIERLYCLIFGVPIVGLRIRYRHISRLLPEHASTILDAGCGRGVITRMLARRFPKASVEGLDAKKRALTTRFPPRYLQGVSWGFAILSEALLLWPYRIMRALVTSEKVLNKLPGYVYTDLLFRGNSLGWFDRLAAPVTFYFTELDVHRMMAAAGFRDVETVKRGTGSARWVARGIRQ